MIEAIIMNLILVLIIIFGYSISSIVFKSKSSLKIYIIQVILFLAISNFLLSKIMTTSSMINQIIVYSVVYMSSISASVLITTLLFGPERNDELIKEDLYEKRFIRFVMNLNKLVPKEVIIKSLKKSKYSYSVIKHFENVLKE